MGSTERQRRLRARRKKHDAGDHSDCIPGRCDALPVPVELDEPGLNEEPGDASGGVTGDVTVAPENSVSHRMPPAGLRERGRRLWEEMAGLKLGPAHVLLLERTCRNADRCERLDAILEGRDWVELVPATPDGAVVRVVMDRALSELRQHEIALKLAVAELRHAGRPATAAGAAPPAAAVSNAEEGAAGGNVRSLAAIRNRTAGG